MELSPTSTRLIFLATMNLSYAMYNLIQQDLLNTSLPLLNFFIILFAFAAVENAIDEKQRIKKETQIIE